MKLADFKAAASNAAMRELHRGPNDVQGYERAVEAARRIEKARSWEQVAQAAADIPHGDWLGAAANRCLPHEL